MKRAPFDSPHRQDVIEGLAVESWMLRHLALAGSPVPPLQAGGHDYLITGKLAGTVLRGDFRRQHTTTIVATLARWFRELHALPCPPNAPRRDVASDLADARERVARNLVELPDNPSALELWTELSENAPMTEESCLTHGDPWPCNFVFDDERGVGVIDWARGGTGPPQRDLAVLDRALTRHYGDEACQQFWCEYGPRPEHLEWYRKLSHLF